MADFLERVLALGVGLAAFLARGRLWRGGRGGRGWRRRFRSLADHRKIILPQQLNNSANCLEWLVSLRGDVVHVILDVGGNSPRRRALSVGVSELDTDVWRLARGL